MNEEKRNKIALFKYSLISSLVSGTHDCVSNAEYFTKYGDKEYKDLDGLSHFVSSSTLNRYYYTYMSKGLDSLKPMKRNDLGRNRKLDEDLQNKIIYYVTNYPRLPATSIYQALLEKEYIKKKDVSLSTINRFINNYKRENKLSNKKEMKRYELEYVNDVWCCDTSYTTYITVNKVKKRTYTIAILDDASRTIVGFGIFLNDNYVNFMQVLKEAIKKYGKPKTLNLDNGSPYKNNQISLLAARIGLSLHYCRPYDPVGKAKIERWFRTFKDQFLSIYRVDSNTTLEMFNKDSKEFVLEYNNRNHSSLNMSPFERFFDSGDEIKRIDDKIESCFLLEIERKVSPDNVIQINNIEYEVPYIYAKKNITLRYSSDFEKVYVVDNNELIEISLLDKVANSKIKRKAPSFNTEESE